MKIIITFGKKRKIIIKFWRNKLKFEKCVKKVGFQNWEKTENWNKNEKTKKKENTKKLKKTKKIKIRKN